MLQLWLGLDIGSISVNTVLIDSGRKIIENHYTYCRGRPFQALRDVLAKVLNRHPPEQIRGAAVTGTGGKLAAELLGGHFVNEIVAQSSSVAALYPRARTVIEMGGEDSKIIIMGPRGLVDFAMNTVCAAGTGSFLDQQARRIGVSIEKEFGELALRSANPPHIAGRCSVFAKSDMIHLQQIATPVEDIVAGLCFAVARNLRSNLARGRELEKPVVFQGGVAANAGMVRAFREVLGLIDGELIIPEYHASMGAIGAVFHVLGEPSDGDRPFLGLSGLEQYLANPGNDLPHWEPLKRPRAGGHKQVVFRPDPGGKLDVYLGIDVGSLSTNVVLIDGQTNVVARRYLPTAGKPLEAIRRGLAEIFEEVGAQVEVRGVGTTGSGRYLTGHFVGADTIKNEITAQATAAIFYHPEVDTVFEIGGQDSKFISIDGGVIVDFEMNKVCAAGTGSFLEEQAEKLGISIVEEFGELALGARKPSRLGDRCTVFMESDLNSHQQKGAAKEDLVGGLAHSIVLNYIQKVVGAKRIGEHILFQGGVTNNQAVVAAFEKVTGKQIIVPPHFDVTGAIGAAMLARKQIMETGARSAFKGFQVSKTSYTMSRFTCPHCDNHCDVHKVQVEGQKRSLFYGDRCDRYQPAEVQREKDRRRRETPNLVRLREKLLLGDWQAEAAIAGSAIASPRPTIGIPRCLMAYYQRFPYWRAFFEQLGFRVVLSRPSDRPLVTRSLGMLVAETCFPVEVMHGHVQDLLEANSDYIFLPFIVDNPADADNPTLNYNCPWIQTYPFMIRGAMKGEEREKRFLVPALHFRYSRPKLLADLGGFMRRTFGTSAADTERAVRAAERAQEDFEEAVRAEGRRVLGALPADKVAAVILGRPYNIGDPELNLGLIEKLIDLGVLPIPLDFLPLREEMGGIYEDYDMMYWPNGQKILAAARLVARSERLHAVYLSNFRCGPDSFLAHYVREEMRGKPYLQLEVDEHSADAGLITRCEAFLDSLRGEVRVEPRVKESSTVSRFRASPSRGRTLYFPYMNDSAHLLAAACRACGLRAEVLPMQDQEALEWGRKFTSSRECFPMICTTGSLLKKLHEPGVDPARIAFFMPSHSGPCRFGQYQKLQRLLLSKLGFGEVQIVSPNNRNSYADFSQGQGVKFRLLAWKGLVAAEILGKMRQERRPYEAVQGATEQVYREQLARLESSVEKGARDTLRVLEEAAEAFRGIQMLDMPRKPVVAVVGEIFMRDNPFCSGFVRQRLEELGAETIMAPLREWIELSSRRWAEESGWRGEVLNVAKAKLQAWFQHRIGRRFERALERDMEAQRIIPVERIMELCGPYIHRDYVGDPPIALGEAAALARTGISGVAAILPFTCLPGTIVASLSASFRRDHDELPWVDIAYDGQEDTGIATRLQAFVHQARDYCRRHGYDRPRRWVNELLGNRARV
jgi:predicted CoA-substrate-specific enzyme activase